MTERLLVRLYRGLDQGLFQLLRHPLPVPRALEPLVRAFSLETCRAHTSQRAATQQSVTLCKKRSYSSSLGVSSKTPQKPFCDILLRCPEQEAMLPFVTDSTQVREHKVSRITQLISRLSPAVSRNAPTFSGSSAEAVKCYSQAIAGAEHDHTLFANRSASYLAQQLFDDAITDAVKTVWLKEAWPKGHYRCQSFNTTVCVCTS